MNNENGSGVNTVLIVIVLIIIVGALAWFFRGGFTQQEGARQPEADKKIEIDVNLPTGQDQGQGQGQGAGSTY